MRPGDKAGKYRSTGSGWAMGGSGDGLRRKRLGLSLVEVMISVAIAAMLLTAVAAAFTASSAAIENNDQFFRATQAARVSMTRLLTEVRRGEYIAVSSDAIEFIHSDADGNVKQRTYRYFPATAERAGQLRLFDADDGPDHPGYVLASNVHDMKFNQESEAINEDGVLYVVRVAIVMVVEIGDNRIRLSGSAVPRRNIRY